MTEEALKKMRERVPAEDCDFCCLRPASVQVLVEREMMLPTASGGEVEATQMVTRWACEECAKGKDLA